MKLLPILTVLLCSLMLNFNCLYKSAKIKKNKNLRHFLESLTERVETDDGKNEYARLTQAPLVHIKLAKAKFNTSLQSILVQSYSEKIKQEIGKTNFDMKQQKKILEELNDSLEKMNITNSLLIEQENYLNMLKENTKDELFYKKKLIEQNKYRNKYFPYLNDTNINTELFYFPVYKTFKSNSSHFKNGINASLPPSRLLEKGEETSASNYVLKDWTDSLIFPERGDKIIDMA